MTSDIVPDDKNWTWVLEQRCDDCGFEAARFDPLRTGAAVREVAHRWTRVLERGDVRQRPRPDRWSPLEYGCHVRDVLRIFDTRLALMLGEDEPRFANWDQDRTAIEDDYGSQDPVVVSAELVAAAGPLSDRFDSVAGDQWQRRGLRSDGSMFTVESIARYFIHDPLHHLWDVGAELPVY